MVHLFHYLPPLAICSNLLQEVFFLGFTRIVGRMRQNFKFNISEESRIMALESGSEKVQEICELIKRETLEPAKEEAQRIITKANVQADEVIKQAHQDADDILVNLKKELEKQQKVADASIELAIKQGKAKLRQEITALFSQELSSLITKEMQQTQVIAKIIEAVINAVEKEGMSTKLRAVLAKNASKDEIIAMLSSTIQQKVEEGGIELGHFHGGVMLKLVDKKMCIDMSDEAVTQLLADYCSDELREKIFASG